KAHQSPAAIHSKSDGEKRDHVPRYRRATDGTGRGGGRRLRKDVCTREVVGLARPAIGRGGERNDRGARSGRGGGELARRRPAGECAHRGAAGSNRKGRPTG